MNWESLASNLGIASVLAWYLYYNTTVTLPGMLQAFRDELETERHQRDMMADKFIVAIGHLEERYCPFGRDVPRTEHERP